ncbi:MAG: ribose-5-phosphate isomerase RpiA [Planctomycetota bacterium]
MDPVARAKQAAGRRAALFVEDGTTLGLGTGSTVRPFLEALGERIAKEGLRVRGVPTSEDTARRAEQLGIPLASLDEVTAIDLTVDGADEIDGAFDMIKGGGGALLREKVVARLTTREVIVADASKVVTKLGTTFDLPIEVVPFALSYVQREVERVGLVPKLRVRDGAPYRTDNGNLILDAKAPGGIADAAGLDRDLGSITGVVDTGLFVGLAHVLVVGREDGETEVREKG